MKATVGEERGREMTWKREPRVESEKVSTSLRRILPPCRGCGYEASGMSMGIWMGGSILGLLGASRGPFGASGELFGSLLGPLGGLLGPPLAMVLFYLLNAPKGADTDAPPFLESGH